MMRYRIEMNGRRYNPEDGIMLGVQALSLKTGVEFADHTQFTMHEGENGRLVFEGKEMGDGENKKG